MKISFLEPWIYEITVRRSRSKVLLRHQQAYRQPKFNQKIDILLITFLPICQIEIIFRTISSGMRKQKLYITNITTILSQSHKKFKLSRHVFLTKYLLRYLNTRFCNISSCSVKRMLSDSIELIGTDLIPMILLLLKTEH